VTTRTLARSGILVVVLCIAIVIGIRLGAVPLGVRTIVEAFLGRGTDAERAIVLELRAPRVLLAALCGAALALSGAAYQALFRNPLAEPYILGISSGAAVGAVLAVVLRFTALGPWSLPAAAFLGALGALALVLRAALVSQGLLDRHVLLLAGVVVGAFCNAGVLLFLSFADAESFRSAVYWMMGSLGGATWERVGVMAVVLGVGGIALLAQARTLDLLAIGEPTAAALGVHVERAKRLGFLTAALLAAAAVSVAGVIGFVGLVVPHAIRLMRGSMHRELLPSAALLGAAFLVLADVLARTVAAPVDLPIGVVTALIGVPLFVMLLRRGRTT